MRLIFAGTPDFAATVLRRIIEEAGHEVVAVYTQPDRQAGRGRKVKFSAVKEVALAHDIAVEQPLNFREQTTIDELKKHGADMMVVVAYGLLLPESVLSTFEHGCINVHASLLPRWRGAAPIQRAIEAGDAQTGVAIMQMDKGLDTGDVLHEVTTPISTKETAQSLHDKLAVLGADALVDVLNAYPRYYQARQVQADTGVLYAHKLQKAEAQIDWTQTADTIAHKIRAFHPWPVCFSHLNDEVVRIHEARVCDNLHHVREGAVVNVSTEGIDVACGDNTVLRLLSIQMPNKKRLPVADVLNGHKAKFTGDACFMHSLMGG